MQHSTPMSREAFIVLRIVFSLMILAGIVVGFSGSSVNGVDCGSYIEGPNLIAQGESVLGGGPFPDYSDCDGKRATRGTIMWVLLLVGLAGNLACFALKPKQPEPATASSSGGPGWYPDPNDARWLAYWDGEQWIETDERYPNAPT